MHSLNKLQCTVLHFTNSTIPHQTMPYQSTHTHYHCFLPPISIPNTLLYKSRRDKLHKRSYINALKVKK